VLYLQIEATKRRNTASFRLTKGEKQREVGEVNVYLSPALRGKSVLVVARYCNTNGEGPWGETASAVVA
jgi:hypothetical protein